MKKQILKKLSNVLVQADIEESAEQYYSELESADRQTFMVLSDCFGLTYEEENYILFSNGCDKYLLCELYGVIDDMVKYGELSVYNLRKCHFIYNYLDIWNNWDFEDTECMCDIEEYLCDAISLMKDKREQEAYCLLSSVLESLKLIEKQNIYRRML